MGEYTTETCEQVMRIRRAELQEPVLHRLESDIAFDRCAVVVVQQVLLVERPVSVHEEGRREDSGRKE